MVSSTASAGPQPAPAAGSNPSTPPDAHEADVENREAYEYWGYLFKSDKTGTDKLKALLRGLKQVMNDKYETSDQPDLTPNQLAHFYRDLHGNYDQLFLGTPHESIAFIYKSLGCLHSLQPAHHTHATAFTDPTVPALKTEGWIMWQTIQVLLGPEEHSTFLREAVEQWDVKDVQTGESFPKILPRECFPREPDRHMVAWYEGVSERLRREAEEEEKHKQVEVHYEPDQRRLHGRLRPSSRKDADGGGTDDEGSVDSRGPALAYFRNPLYRHVDGRPSIVRQQSKRPALSPRQTMIDKGKEAASTFSRIARNVGSPHLWDGRGGSRSGSHDTRRRKSHPDSRLHHSTSPPDDDVLLPTSTRGSYDSHHRSSQGSHRTHRRKGSSPLERPVSVSSTADDEWWENDSDKSPVYSPAAAAASASIRHTSSHSHSHFRPEVVGSPLRHSRSEEPTPSVPVHDTGDYFSTNVPVETEEGESRPPTQDHEPGDAPPPLHQRGTTPPPVPAPNGVGVMFGPSAGPLFASTVAAAVPPRGGSGQGGRAPFSPPMGLGGMHRHRHTQSLGPKASPQRTRFEDSPPREERRERFDDGREPSSDRYRHRHEHGHRSRDRDWDRGDRDRDRHAPPPGDRSRRSGESSRHSHSRKSSRRYESPRGYDDDEDLPSPEEFRDEKFDDGRRGSRGGGGGGRGSRPISGEAGVKGRRYPEQSPWGRGG
ncbi:unnamed protein product [Zymoseptoria tritici ST99CH_1A5]|uniref:DUF7514 domain-containing protein n=1 Tax=Zymoseptoria tritici ST99CH_1A5 TaxID=1276529 RepID=A0A1Y6L2I6_ZYMTR|nr:unnamed protein product [Zymoseptoria tritici ST99CH_1A5]